MRMLKAAKANRLFFANSSVSQRDSTVSWSWPRVKAAQVCRP